MECFNIESFVGLVPSVFGYDISGSLAVVGLRRLNQLGVVACSACWDMSSPGELAPAAASIVTTMSRERVDGIVMVTYPGSLPDHDIAGAVLTVMTRLFRDAQVEVLGAFEVTGPVMRDVATGSPWVPVPVCEGAGQPQVTRNDLAVRVAASAPAERHRPALVALSEGSEPVPASKALQAWSQVLTPEVEPAALRGLPAEVVALAVWSLRDPGLRDALLAWMCPGTLSLDELPDGMASALRTTMPERLPWWGAGGDGRTVLSERLQDLCQAVPDEWAAPVATVAAWGFWWLGNGVMANLCLERATTCQPGYRLAELLTVMVSRGIRPRTSTAER